MKFLILHKAVKDILAKDEFNTDVGMTLDLEHVKYTIKDKTDFTELPTDKLMKKVEQYDQSSYLNR